MTQRIARFATAALVAFLLRMPAQADEPDAIKNPYYTTPQWKLWDRDSTPVASPMLIKPGLVGEIAMPPEADRLFPDDPDKSKPGVLVAFRKTDWPEREYAGFWDDVYESTDNNGTTPPTPHSWMPGCTTYNKFGYGVPDLTGKFMAIYCPHFFGLPMKLFGVNFTSQSTTGMGHDIANSGGRVGVIEREMYFANCLRAGPAANGAYAEQDFFNMQDKYEALVPCYYNSCGQSGSEIHALAKMMIAGGYLPKELKPELKRNGLYIATLLYIWKAALPYDAPYDCELRHRVAYVSTGDQLDKGYYPVNREFHLYDEAAHLANMINLAKSMTVAPPVSILKKIDLAGGEEKYFHKTAALIYQKAGETIKLRVSTADCFDLAGKPITCRFKVLYGNLKTTIEKDGEDSYLITVPPDEKLPRGRTSILLIANNGVYDSNPACINIYRPDGPAQNRRPTLEGLSDRTIFPGEKVMFHIKSEDPDGFATVLYRRTGEVGTLSGNTFTWDCPSDTADGVYPVTILASDTTTGTNSGKALITVTSTRAIITADTTSGPSPFTVKFSAANSRDRKNNSLSYQWDFGDGTTSTDAQVEHRFPQPGFYQVTLTVKGPLGSHSEQVVVTAAHSWPLQLDNGWDRKGLDSTAWNTGGLAPTFATIKGDNLQLSRPKDNNDILETAKTFQPPFYLEAKFNKFWATKGDGFDILGCHLGWGNGGGAPFFIGNLTTDKKQDIGPYLSGGTAESATLRLYVVPDPKNAGKVRYTGYLDTLQGNYFFCFDDQAPTDPAALKILSTFSRFEISRFHVWSAK